MFIRFYNEVIILQLGKSPEEMALDLPGGMFSGNMTKNSMYNMT